MLNGKTRPLRAYSVGFILLLCAIFAGFANISRASNITEYGLPNGGSRPATIVYGADNFYWVAGFQTGQIIRITPTNGAMKAYGIPSSASYPFGLLSLGTNIWFTEYGANKIGLLYTNTDTGSGDHTFKEFPIHASNNTGILCGPAGMTLGPDGNLWFVE
ncbi:MAG TPA: hypothetical protein VFC07_05710, partial [Verrucomicrobiae bacterium]|nr:hypothetical protein [Verrucomicrobiae bacterium]